jgi:hypothetical protein
MEAIEEKRIGNYLIKIFPDEDPESPNDWGDEERFLVFDHRQFYVERKGFSPRDIYAHGGKVKGYYVFRCYAYIHSGVALAVESHSFPDARWDVSSTGWWLIKREKGTWTRKAALKAAEELCETWNEYLSGDVYGYKIFETKDGCDTEDDDSMDELDSCWGFYGQEYCMTEAESLVNHYIKKDNEHSEVLSGNNG